MYLGVLCLLSLGLTVTLKLKVNYFNLGFYGREHVVLSMVFQSKSVTLFVFPAIFDQQVNPFNFLPLKVNYDV